MINDGTVYVVDNDQRTTEMISALAKEMHLECRPYTSGLRMLEEIDIEKPGCIVSEIRIPDIGGLQLQRRLAEMGASTPIIFLANHWSVPIVVRAMKAGAFHFFEKPFEEQSIWEVVQDAVYRDREECDKRRQLRTYRTRMDRLTRTEREVLESVLVGQPNRVIAEQQNVSVRTVELRRSRLMDKLGAGSLADLVRISLLARGDGGQDLPTLEPATVP